MITPPDREMPYVTRIFNGQYLMAETPALARTIREATNDRASIPASLFAARKFAEIFQFRYARAFASTRASGRARDPENIIRSCASADIVKPARR